jgi:hypothetical protein
MAVFFAYMWSNIETFMEQNPALTGMAIVTIVAILVFSIQGFRKQP